jgi:hypothetical protein
MRLSEIARLEYDAGSTLCDLHQERNTALGPKWSKTIIYRALHVAEQFWYCGEQEQVRIRATPRHECGAKPRSAAPQDHVKASG